MILHRKVGLMKSNMEVTLFVGNGINRLEAERDVSWGKVLEDLARKLGRQSLLDLRDNKPFTLIYETLLVKLFQRGNKQDLLLKKYVSNSMLEMMPNQYHRKFLNLGVKNIITSNYDYCFEMVSQTEIKHFNVKRESKYSAFRRTKVGDAYIWHIHGEVEEPESIMLGYEQYGGYLQKIRKYLLPSQKRRELNIANLKKKFDRRLTNSWVDLFLRDEVHILGFSMDYSEIDIWWLLVFKAQCQARYGIKPGRTIYYHWTKSKEDDLDRAKLQLLEALGVKISTRFEIDSFEDCYNNFKIANV